MPYWFRHLRLPVVVVLTVLLPAAVALTFLAQRNLSSYRYELEQELADRLARQAELMDRRLARRLDRLEAEVIDGAVSGPDAGRALRVVRMRRARHLTVHVDLLTASLEPAPLIETAEIPRPEKCEAAGRWIDLAGQAATALESGRLDEATRMYTALADSRSPLAGCPHSQSRLARCPPEVHLIGTLGRLQATLLNNDAARVADGAKHLREHHLDDRRRTIAWPLFPGGPRSGPATPPGRPEGAPPPGGPNGESPPSAKSEPPPSGVPTPTQPVPPGELSPTAPAPAPSPAGNGPAKTPAGKTTSPAGKAPTRSSAKPGAKSPADPAAPPPDPAPAPSDPGTSSPGTEPSPKAGTRPSTPSPVRPGGPSFIPPTPADLPPLLETWFTRCADASSRAKLSAVLSDLQNARTTAAAASARLALGELLEWRRTFELSRNNTLWHSSAANLAAGIRPSVSAKIFIRIAHPDLSLLAVAKLPDGEGWVTYRPASTEWWADVAALLSDIPGEFAAELVDAAGAHLAGTELSASDGQTHQRSLLSVPGWKLRIRPSDATPLTAAAERLAGTNVVLVAVVLVSVGTGLGFLLISYVRQARLHRLQTDFVTSVSHELKTPLAQLRMSAETLMMGRFRTEEQGRDLKRRLVEQADRLGRLVGQVLEFSRLEHRRGSVPRMPVNLRQLVHELLTEYRLQLENLRAEVRVLPPLAMPMQSGEETDLYGEGTPHPLEVAVAAELARLPDAAPGETPSPGLGIRQSGILGPALGGDLRRVDTPAPAGADAGPPAPYALCDADALRQVLINLLDNALRYTDGPPRVTLSAEPAGSRVRLRVADAGIGMDAETRKRVFEEFYRGSATAVQRHRGTGLGLAIVRRIVRTFGGEVTVESAAGRGSRFTVELPAAPGPQPAAESKVTAG